jgi:hypothetical protein
VESWGAALQLMGSILCVIVCLTKVQASKLRGENHTLFETIHVLPSIEFDPFTTELGLQIEIEKITQPKKLPYFV